MNALQRAAEKNPTTKEKAKKNVWTSWWAITLYSLLGIGAVAGVYYMTQKKKPEAAEQAEVA
jgi:hypothetical protein